MAHVVIRVLSRSKFRTGTARGKPREVGDVRGFCSRVTFVGLPSLEFSIPTCPCPPEHFSVTKIINH